VRFDRLFFLCIAEKERKMKSLFVVNLRLPNEYREWVNDMVKAFVVLTSLHVLQYGVGRRGGDGGLFSANFWRLIIFVIIGFSAYYLVVRKLIRFRYLGEAEADDGQSPHSFNLSLGNLFTPLTRFRVWLKEKL